MNKDYENNTTDRKDPYEGMTPLEKAYFKRFENYPNNGVLIHYEDTNIFSDKSTPVCKVVGTLENLLYGIAFTMMHMSEITDTPVVLLTKKLVETIRELDTKMTIDKLTEGKPENIKAVIKNVLNMMDNMPDPSEGDGDECDCPICSAKREGREVTFEDFIKRVTGDYKK